MHKTDAVIRVFTYCRIRPRGSRGCRNGGKNVSKQVITTAQCRWMKNIKELICMKAKEAGLTSRHVFIMSKWPESKTGKWKQCSPGQILTELCRWDIESEIPTSPEDKEKKKRRKKTTLKMCLTSKAYRTYSTISVTLMLWNIPNASLLAFCKKAKPLSSL